MPDKPICFRVFISSPGDVDSERNLVLTAIQSINNHEGRRSNFGLEAFDWRTNVVRQIGPKPQEVVDAQTPDYDIYIGIMASKIGSGGTIQEYRNAVQRWRETGRPHVSFFFRKDVELPQELSPVRQYGKVIRFRKELESKNGGQGLVGVYKGLRGSDDAFYDTIRLHLMGVVHQLVAPGAPPSDTRDMRAYLRWVGSTNHSIDIRGIGSGARQTNSFPIDQLYITLSGFSGGDPSESRAASNLASTRSRKRRSQSKGLRTKDDGKRESNREPELAHRSQNLDTVLATSKRLVVVGDPGAGKTTFLRRLAYHLSQEALGESAGSEHESLLKTLRDQPFPLFMKVGSFAQVLENAKRTATPNAPPTDDALDWIPYFLHKHSGDHGHKLPIEFFRDQLREQRCTLLIDGLDEAPNAALRQRIIRIVEACAARYPDCRYVVTSRPAALADGFTPAGFATARIDDLSDEAIQGFLGKWCAALCSDEHQRAKHLESLTTAIRAKPEIRRMGRNPVMLTALAVVHWHEGRMPENRVALYEAILDWLAQSRAKRRQESDPKALSADETMERFGKLATLMQTDPSGRKTQVSRRWAAERLAAPRTSTKSASPLEPGKGSPGDLAAIDEEQVAYFDRFLHAEELDSGIIVGRGTDVAFWHLTFQEYLAGWSIARLLVNSRQQLLFAKPERLFSPEWREMMTLMAGCLRRNHGVEHTDQLIAQILDWLDQQGPASKLASQARCAGLIGVMARDLAQMNYQVSDSRYGALLQDVMAIFDPKRVAQVAIQDRIEAADALASVDDPRLDRNRPDYWVAFPADPQGFWMGAQSQDPRGRNYDPVAFKDESPAHQVTLSAFSMAKYPVTVGEFALFIAQEGYQTERYWSAGGFQDFQAPEEWEDQLPFKSRPVANVSWYEAMAFSQWAGCQLPTEAQWERAARGLESRRYPWGDEAPLAEQINFIENNKTSGRTPVGIFPLGTSPEGITDLVGNVWEWCRDGRRKYERSAVHDPVGPDVGSRCVRGGCWYYNARSVRCAYRLEAPPESRYEYLGFRLVRVQDGS